MLLIIVFIRFSCLKLYVYFLVDVLFLSLFKYYVRFMDREFFKLWIVFVIMVILLVS